MSLLIPDPLGSIARAVMVRLTIPMDQGSVLVGAVASHMKLTTRICPTLSKFYDRARVNEVLSLPEVVELNLTMEITL